MSKWNITHIHRQKIFSINNIYKYNYNNKIPINTKETKATKEFLK